MRLKVFTNEALIKAKADNVWEYQLAELKLPSKIHFIAEVVNPTVIRKMRWDFGDDTKIVTVTNKKIEIRTPEIIHNYKPKNLKDQSTLSVQASVYMEKCVIVTKPFVIASIKPFDTSHYYIDPVVFKQEIVEYYASGGEVTESLGESLAKIATRLAYATNFINYSYRDDMIGDALIKMMMALKKRKYCPDKGNPYSYFGKIAYRAFVHRIINEKKAHETVSFYKSEIYDSFFKHEHSTNDEEDGTIDGNK